MSGDLRPGDEDQQPELRSGERAPVKKPMVQFLAEFEERLRNHPDEPATGALRLVEERAGGQRRSPHEAGPTALAGAAPESAAAGKNTAEPAPEPSDGDGDGDGGENAAVAAPAEGAAETAAAGPGELRRLRGRRRRKHRHRAQ